ncbi:MarR family winged helix-turn-helix transcriptional regulator [Frondihabitans cladoniiphilus]|uniref:HTH marR-type domain-containing protein n=1 Tax=Frondihabitans cladoniiphilus TaxID=715785 RepID=A0ABP8VVZ3_9MICO
MSTHEANDPPPFDYDPSTPSGAVIEALYALQDAEALFRGRLRDRLGIGANDLAALQYLARLETVGKEVRPRDLTRTLGVTSAAATIILSRLELRGFVTRTPDPSDGRGQILRLTPQAKKALATAIGTSQGGVRTLFASISDREAKRLVQLLSAVTASLDAGAPLDR